MMSRRQAFASLLHEAASQRGEFPRHARFYVEQARTIRTGDAPSQYRNQLWSKLP